MPVTKPQPAQHQGQLQAGAGGWRGQHGASQRCGQGSQAPDGAAGARFLHAEPLLSPIVVVSGTLVLLELQPAPEPSLEPKDGGKEPEQDQPKGQHQATWKEGSPGSPATTQEPSGEQSHQVDQRPLGQPSAGSQVQNWQHRPGLPLLSTPGAGGPVGEGGLVAWGACVPLQLTTVALSLPAARCWGAQPGAGASWEARGAGSR